MRKSVSISCSLFMGLVFLGGCGAVPSNSAKKGGETELKAYDFSLDGTSTITGQVADGETSVEIANLSATEYVRQVVIDLGAEFLVENICAGKTIFGRLGTAACNGVFADVASSSAFREGTTYPRSTAQATLSEQAAHTAAFTSGHRLVPVVAYDHDGYGGDNDAGAQANYFATVYGGRPASECGTSATMIASGNGCAADADCDDAASIAERMEHCKQINPTRYIWEAAKYASAGEGDWRLVTRTSGAEEVWRDERTGLLWGDRAGTYNWFRAAGNTESAAQAGYEGQPGVGTGCSGVACQPATPISVCADLSGFDPSTIGAAHKGGMSDTASVSSPSVLWYLPTIEDWKQADVNGVRKVLPNMDYGFWSASSYSDDRSLAWVFVGGYGYVYDGDRDYVGNSVRCVGR